VESKVINQENAQLPLKEEQEEVDALNAEKKVTCQENVQMLLKVEQEEVVVLLFALNVE